MSTFIGMKVNKKKIEEKKIKELTVAETKAKLDELGIEYSNSATKAELLKLLPAE